MQYCIFQLCEKGYKQCWWRYFFAQLHAHNFTPFHEDTGLTDIYPCEKIDSVHRMFIDLMDSEDGDNGSDIWGCTDPETGKGCALTILSFGTTIADISDPDEPIYVGKWTTIL